jgi:hypothetical protein
MRSKWRILGSKPAIKSSSFGFLQMALKSDVIYTIIMQLTNMLNFSYMTNKEIKNKGGKLLYFKA